jgi:hypothetical protein
MIQDYKEIEGWFGYESHYDKAIQQILERHAGRCIPTAESNWNMRMCPLNIVEIGAWLGRSSFYLVDKLNLLGGLGEMNIYIVDTWLGSKSEIDTHHAIAKEVNLYVDFMRNMRKLHGLFTPVRATSVEAATIFEDKTVDYVFIDAEHTYEAVKADIEAWLPKMSSIGIIAGHDYDSHWPGVIKAVHEKFGNEVKVEGDVWIIENPQKWQ